MASWTLWKMFLPQPGQCYHHSHLYNNNTKLVKDRMDTFSLEVKKGRMMLFNCKKNGISSTCNLGTEPIARRYVLISHR